MIDLEKIKTEHKVMLDYLKSEYNREGVVFLGDLIKKIDPEWKSRWDLIREEEEKFE